MADIKFFKVAVLPGVLQANALYFVENGGYAESYLTNKAGVAKSLGNTAMINALADARVTAGLANLNALEIVANIAARNALAGNNRNQMVLVIDATGDATVAAGSALYAFRNSDDTWLKLTEYESLDVVVQWANISGKPASAAALIDDAVNKRHAHANLAVLDLITAPGGVMNYNGTPVGGAPAWTNTDW